MKTVQKIVFGTCLVLFSCVEKRVCILETVFCDIRNLSAGGQRRCRLGVHISF